MEDKKKQKWVTHRIHADSELNKSIQNDKDQPAWKILENLYKNNPKSNLEVARITFDEFIFNMNKLYPGCERRMMHLGPLIFRKILPSKSDAKKDQIDDEYYEMIKEW